MTTEQKISILANILKKITQEKITKNEDILNRLKQNSGSVFTEGFLVDEEKAKAEKKTLSKAAKDHEQLLNDLKAELKNIEKCLTEK